MDTNTIMLIALAVLLVLSAVGIWLVNRGTGVESVATDEDEEVEVIETAEDTDDPETVSTRKTREDTSQ